MGDLMKSLLVVLAFGVLSFAQNASAIVTCELMACTSAVSIDSGHSALQCLDDGSVSCTKASLCSGCACTVISSGSFCTQPWNQIGQYIDGRRICSKTCPQPQDQPIVDETVVQATGDSTEVADVFQPEFTNVYYGYVDTNNRSPNAGRANSIHARLDVCMGGTDVDSITASGWNAPGEQSCEADCGGSGSLNDYCNQNTGTVCKDRCACLYQYNGVGGLTCNNL
jgi:hypothetical protein